MTPAADEVGELLRARGLRSTPQRRAILATFRGERAEHLSADEVYAKVSGALPDLSRGTVYATLAEFSELGLLAAFGAPEPVRYETNTDPHAHFRCRLCLRVFDLASGLQEPGQITDAGFIVERVDTRAEGICVDCRDYDIGLRAGANAIARSGPSADVLAAPGAAASEIEGPLGRMSLAATSHGLTRVAFDGHGDAELLRAYALSRRGSQAARRHLAACAEALDAYFAGAIRQPECLVDWTFLESSCAMALKATQSIPHGEQRSYSNLGVELPARALGRIMGANPIPIVAPCHRVIRGSEVPSVFVGGAQRRTWLEHHERTHREAKPQ